jgi:peptidyl-prolyl cis-trans isomerase D
VKDALRKQAVEQLAGAKITDISNAFEDARAGGASFSDAAIRVGMHVTHIPQVDIKTGLAPDGTKVNLPTSPEFLPQLAKSDIGVEGDPFPTTDGHAYAIKVNGVTPSRLKPLDSVRPQIVAAWTADQREHQLAKLAATLALKATADRSLTAIAAQLHTSVKQTGGLARQTPSTTLSPVLVQRIFAAPPGSAVAAPGPNGTYIVARVTGVSHPALPAGDPMFRKFTGEIAEQAGQDIGYLMADAWRDKLGVTINQSQVDRLAGGS